MRIVALFLSDSLPYLVDYCFLQVTPNDQAHYQAVSSAFRLPISPYRLIACRFAQYFSIFASE